jgi:hypothetical protein
LQPFDSPRSDAVYCSPACRQRAYRERQAAAVADRARTAAMIASYEDRLHGGAA